MRSWQANFFPILGLQGLMAVGCASQTEPVPALKGGSNLQAAVTPTSVEAKGVGPSFERFHHHGPGDPGHHHPEGRVLPGVKLRLRLSNPPTFNLGRHELGETLEGCSWDTWTGTKCIEGQRSLACFAGDLAKNLESGGLELLDVEGRSHLPRAVTSTAVLPTALANSPPHDSSAPAHCKESDHHLEHWGTKVPLQKGDGGVWRKVEASTTVAILFQPMATFFFEIELPPGLSEEQVTSVRVRFPGLEAKFQGRTAGIRLYEQTSIDTFEHRETVPADRVDFGDLSDVELPRQQVYRVQRP